MVKKEVDCGGRGGGGLGETVYKNGQAKQLHTVRNITEHKSEESV